MLYAPIDTLHEMRQETFKNTRRPLDDDAVARIAWQTPDEAPNPIGLAFVNLRDLDRLPDRLSRLARLFRSTLRRPDPHHHACACDPVFPGD